MEESETVKCRKKLSGNGKYFRKPIGLRELCRLKKSGNTFSFSPSPCEDYPDLNFWPIWLNFFFFCSILCYEFSVRHRTFSRESQITFSTFIHSLQFFTDQIEFFCVISLPARNIFCSYDFFCTTSDFLPVKQNSFLYPNTQPLIFNHHHHHHHTHRSQSRAKGQHQSTPIKTV